MATYRVISGPAKVEFSSDGERWQGVSSGTFLHSFALSIIPAVQEEVARLRALEEERLRSQSVGEAWGREIVQGISVGITADRFNWRLFAALYGDHSRKVQRYRRLQPYYRMVRSKETS